jgi:hypothetical protein
MTRPRRPFRTIGRGLVALSLCTWLVGVGGVAPQVGAVAGAATCPSVEVHNIRGWLHKCGTAIVDGSGHIVRPITVSWFTMSKDQGRDSSTCQAAVPPAEHWYTDLHTWGFNAVYLGISWANVEPTKPTYNKATRRYTHHYDGAYLRAVDSIVNKFAAQGVKVILLMGQSRWSSAFTKLHLPSGVYIPCGFGMPSWLYSGKDHTGDLLGMVRAEVRFFNNDKLQGWFARAWQRVVKRYITNRNVIGASILHEAYDILAQRSATPYPGTANLRPRDLHLARFYERVAAAIHKINPRLLIFVLDQLNWDTHRFALTRKPKIRRAAYSFEFYAPNWKTTGLPRIESYWARARAWGWPAWVEEFYAFLPTYSGDPRPSWQTNAEKFLAYAKERHIGWSFGLSWRLTQNDPPELIPTLQGGF